MDFVPMWFSVLGYSVMMISWVYFRFYAFTSITLVVFGLGARISVDNYTEIGSATVILLITLLGLNIYWFILLVRMGYGLITNGRAKDIQAKLNLKSKSDH